MLAGGDTGERTAERYWTRSATKKKRRAKPTAGKHAQEQSQLQAREVHTQTAREEQNPKSRDSQGGPAVGVFLTRSSTFLSRRRGRSPVVKAIQKTVEILQAKFIPVASSEDSAGSSTSWLTSLCSRKQVTAVQVQQRTVDMLQNAQLRPIHTVLTTPLVQ